MANKSTRGRCVRLGYLAGLGLSVETIMSDGRQGPKHDLARLDREDACRKEVAHVSMTMETI